MGNSTTSVQDIIDTIASTGGDLSPQANPGNYGTKLSLRIANDVMADLLSGAQGPETAWTNRFNWKWNSKLAAVFYTNTYQQDYPQIGLVDVDWLEIFQWVDINNTSIPKPISRPQDTYCVRSLPRLSLGMTTYGWPSQLSWDYNKNLSYGTWPGANKVYYPLVSASNVAQQNGPMAILDANGNILVLTTPSPTGTGTTGNTAPLAAVNAAEGVTVTDGTCVWTVAGPNSQGFRVWPLPGATGPVYQIQVRYQMIAPKLTTLQSLINPVPDNYSMYFRRGFIAHSLAAAVDPKLQAQGRAARGEWLQDLAAAARQGDREQVFYGLVPASFPMDSPNSGMRNPRDPGQPY